MPNATANQTGSLLYARGMSPAVANERSLYDAWWRVPLAAALFFCMFFIMEHELRFAGHSIGAQDEQEILEVFADGAEQGNKARQLVLVFFGAIGALAIVANRRRVLNASPVTLTLLLLFLALIASSFLWSAAPVLCLRRLIALACVLVGCWGIAKTFSPTELAEIAVYSLLAFTIVSFAIDTRAGGRPWMTNYRLSGTLHSNVQATYCATLAVAAAALATAGHRRSFHYGVLVWALFLLVLTGSRTSLLAALIACAATWFLQRKRIVFIGIVSSFIAGVALLSVVYVSLSPQSQRALTGAALLGRTDDTGTLSGRVPLWEELFDYIDDRPLLGYGYDSFWTPGVMEDIMDSQEWSMSSAHNAYFEVVLQLGMVGLALTLPLIVATLVLAGQRFWQTKEAGCCFIFGIVVLAMLNGLMESHFTKTKYTTMLAIAGALIVILYRHEGKKELISTEASPYGSQAAMQESLLPEGSHVR